MGDVTDRVIDLSLIERAARPVGKARALVDLNTEPAVDQVGIANLLPLAERHRRDLGVEHRMRGLAGEIVDDLYVLPAGVEDLQHVLVIDQQIEQRLHIEPRRLGIDRRGLFRVGDLDQAEFGPIGILSHEFCVDAYEGSIGEARAQIGEGGAVGN